MAVGAQAACVVVEQRDAVEGGDRQRALHLGWDAVGVLDRASEHEQVVFCHDQTSGLRAIVGIYSTALGPALGGTRFYPYGSEADALTDVLKLSKAMAYKNALAGLDFGGGKAVIIGDPAVNKSEALLRTYGRFVQGLGGRYITACDVGTSVEDMDVVARESSHVIGRSTADGGAGDSSVLTAFGVYQGMLAAARYRWETDGLAGRRVGISGVGKVGRHLVQHVVDEKARVVITDVEPDAVDWVRDRYPDVEAVADNEVMLRTDLDVYAPCALGGVLDDEAADILRAAIVCGGANNQLAHDQVAVSLHERGVVYCPDYLVNAGGVIQVAEELRGFSFERARAKATKIHDATLAVLRTAEAEGVTPLETAHRLAERRMASVAAIHRIWIGHSTTS
jgi:valine dehydrogenase (NAD+)